MSATQLLFEFLKALIDAYAFPNCADDAYAEDEPVRTTIKNAKIGPISINLIRCYLCATGYREAAGTWCDNEAAKPK